VVPGTLRGGAWRPGDVSLGHPRRPRHHPVKLRFAAGGRAVQEDGLANTKSAKKRIRQNSRRRTRNIKIRTRARSRVRVARASVAGDDSAQAEQAVKAAIQELDRAASKGVIHPNNAARRKSRLHRSLKTQAAKP
jgi:small subunit ribosomal protein S20